MLPLRARDELLDALPHAYWIDISGRDENAGYSGWGIRPDIRWQKEDYETPEPPYDEIALRLDPTGVIEPNNQSVDRRRVNFVVPEADQENPLDADAGLVKGDRVYDVLNILVASEGRETRANGALSMSASERAESLCRAVVGFLKNQFQTRPLDAFDENGQPVDDSGRLYAEELSPPVDVRPITGRGPQDVTDMVDANGQQWNAAVELHYFDGYVEWRYTAADVESMIELSE